MNNIPGNRFKIINNTGQHYKFKIGNTYDIATMRKDGDTIIYYFRDLTMKESFNISFPSIELADKFINALPKKQA